LPARITDADRATDAPVHLRRLAGRKGEFEERGTGLGPDPAHIGLDGRVATGVTGFTQALEDLLRRKGMAVQQAGHLPFEGIKQTAAQHTFPGFVVRQGGPGCHRPIIQVQRLRDLT